MAFYERDKICGLHSKLLLVINREKHFGIGILNAFKALGKGKTAFITG